jgi:hypothetical protein
MRRVRALLTTTDGPAIDKAVLAKGTAASKPRLWDLSQAIGTKLQQKGI